MEKLMAFLRGLDETHTHYMLGFYRTDGAITVHVTASGDQRWEVEFFADGRVEIERFVSRGDVDDASVVDRLDELRDAAA